MTDSLRRDVLLGAAGLGACLASPAWALAQLQLPPGPMRLRRDITRELGDGANISVMREWIIRFVRQGSGCAITGKQVAVSVDAPASLAPLTKIERARSTDAMFPILLSGSGMILAAGDSVQSEDMARAVRGAEKLISEGKAHPDTKAERLRGLAAFQRGSSKLIDQIPADLFFPTPGSVKTVQAVSLPNGLDGEFELQQTAKCAPDLPWLAKVERHVTTRIGDSERLSSDTWSMMPA